MNNLSPRCANKGNYTVRRSIPPDSRLFGCYSFCPSVNPLTDTLTLSANPEKRHFCEISRFARGGGGGLQRGGGGRLLRSSASPKGMSSRCSPPLSPTYVVHEVSKMAEYSAHLYLLRASLEKAALISFRASGARAQKSAGFSSLLNRQTDRTARRLVGVDQPVIQLIKGRE